MTLESAFPTAYCVVVAVVLGLCMGSFLNCLAWRMTHGESVLHGRSHCATCGHVLAAYDLVPLASWLVTRGRCRYCGARVSARYPVAEALCAVLYVSIFLRYEIALEALELAAFGSVLLVLSLTDIDEFIIPNSTIVAAIAIRLAYILVGGALGIHDAAALVAASIANGLIVAIPILLLAMVMDHILGKESLGGGDVKLLFVAGMYFGWQQCLFLLVVACVLGIVVGLVGKAHTTTELGVQDKNGALEEPMAAEHTKSSGQADPALIPFGPSIALACWITMIVGSYVLNWYLGLFNF